MHHWGDLKKATVQDFCVTHWRRTSDWMNWHIVKCRWYNCIGDSDRLENYRRM
jgi:hypothetical protein